MKDHMKSASTPRFILKPLAAALMLAALNAHAYQAGVPNSGAILQQVQPALPPAPLPSQPALRIDPANAAGLPASAPFTVSAIRVTGNTAFGAGVLHALVADAEGKTFTLPQLEAVAGRITAYYQAHGFPLSRAIVPAQTITGGAVTIQVLEARYGAVRVQNGSRVGDALLAATAAPLQGGPAITERDLDRTLLLLSDIPGVGVNAVLKPGAQVGSADLDIVASRNPVPFANLALDNYGNRYTGRVRLSASASIVNPLRHGDLLDVSVVAASEDMDYGRIGYDTLLNGAGTRAGAAYSRVHYSLGQDIAQLDAYGSADVASAWIKHPLVRSRQANLYGQLEYDGKRLRDRIDVTATRTDRHLDNWVLSLNGDVRDGFLGGGVSAWSVAWTHGRTRFDDAAAEQADALSTRTRGRFSKWNASLSRVQGLGARDTLYMNLAGQWANGNLDSAEKMTVGGPYTVRAYDVGALSADTGYVGSAEWRHELGNLAGRWQALAFAESARVRINRDPWTPAQNRATLSGAGIGLTWEGAGGWRANASLARRIGALPALAGAQSSVRGWLTAGKAF